MMSFYWITRVDAIWNFSVAMLIVSGIAAFLLITFGIANRTCAFSKESEDYVTGTRLVRGGICSAVLALLFSLCVVFVPTTKEMCAIYVVDYLKDNEKVQKMPEQIIDAAANFLEEQANKGKGKQNDRRRD